MFIPLWGLIPILLLAAIPTVVVLAGMGYFLVGIGFLAVDYLTEKDWSALRVRRNRRQG